MEEEKNTVPKKMDYIDLREVMAKKNPKLPKLLPNFIIRYLERVIHVKEINEFLAKEGHRFGLDFVDAIIENFGAKVETEGMENIPDERRLIFAANHPLGGLDGIALIQVVGRKHKDVLFPVNDILMNITNLQELFIPINKHGSNVENARIIDDTFAGDKTMLYFPAGLCSRKRKGKIVDLEWHKTFISKARKHQRDVVPVYIEGRNSNFFYNLANLRTKLGIKANIEMLYLADEMFKQKNQVIFIKFGKPIPYTTFDRSKKDREWAKYVKRIVYQLGNRQIEE